VLKRFPDCVWKRFLGIETAMPELHLFASEHAGLLGHICGSLAHHAVPAPWQQCILYTAFRTFAEHQLVVRHLTEREVLVVDEGFAQRAFTLYGYLPGPLRDTDIVGYVDQIPAPHALIYVDARPETCATRLAQRPRPPFMLAHLDPAGQRAQLAVGRERLTTAVSRLRGRGVRVETIETDGPLPQILNRIRDCAQSLPGNIAPAGSE
jgi:hypothetical protein